MACGRNATVTITSVRPCSRRSSRMCSMHGLPATGTIGLGWFDVSGRRRVPSPPAMTTAFTLSLPWCHGVQGAGDERDGHAEAEEYKRPRGRGGHEEREREHDERRGPLPD